MSKPNNTPSAPELGMAMKGIKDYEPDIFDTIRDFYDGNEKRVFMRNSQLRPHGIRVFESARGQQFRAPLTPDKIMMANAHLQVGRPVKFNRGGLWSPHARPQIVIQKFRDIAKPGNGFNLTNEDIERIKEHDRSGSREGIQFTPVWR